MKMPRTEVDSSRRSAWAFTRLSSIGALRLFDAGASSKFALGRAQASLALYLQNRLFPRILVAFWVVLDHLEATH